MNSNEFFQIKNKWKEFPTKIQGGVLCVGEIPVVAVDEKELQYLFVEKLFKDSGKKVVEIGYGLGFASDAIQKFIPREHIIIEANQKLARVAMHKFPLGVVLNCFWEDVNPLVFGQADLIIYDPINPLDSKLSGRSLALQHLRPMWEEILPKMNVGARIGGLDASGRLKEVEIQKMVGDLGEVEVFTCPPDVIPRGLPWFNEGCNFIYISKK